MVNSSCDSYIGVFIGSDRFEYSSLSHKIYERYSSSVIHAKDSKEAMDLIQKDPPDLIIINWRIPDMDTIEFITTLRKHTITIDTPLILKLVGVETEEKKEMYRSAGINDFLPRPIRDNVLYEVLDKWLL